MISVECGPRRYGKCSRSSQKRKLPRLWNAWISSDTSLTYTPCARVAVFAAIVFFRQATGSYSIRLWKARFISAVSGRGVFPELSFPFFDALVFIKFVRRIRAHHPAAGHLKYFHDLRMVWPLEIPQRGFVEGAYGQLGHRVFRILFPGSRKPHRLV